MDFDKYFHPGEKILMGKILQTVGEFNNIISFIKKNTAVKEPLKQDSNQGMDDLSVYNTCSLYTSSK